MDVTSIMIFGHIYLYFELGSIVAIVPDYQRGKKKKRGPDS